MVLLDLLMRQNQKGFLAQPLNDDLSNLRWTEYPVQARRTAICTAQHRRSDRLRAKAAHLDAIISVSDCQ